MALPENGGKRDLIGTLKNGNRIFGERGEFRFCIFPPNSHALDTSLYRYIAI